jgi:hypothetical protein
MTLCARRAIGLSLLLTIDTRSALTVQPGELIERTLAIVGGQVLTLSDARAAVTLGLLSGGEGLSDPAAASPRLIERLLMLREVQRYAPPEPAESEVERRLEVVRERFATPGLYETALQASGFTEVRLRGWIRDDLRVASYLEQRFAAAAAPSGIDASDPSRVQLAAERRAALIADWLEDLRRRTVVVELWKRQE